MLENEMGDCRPHNNLIYATCQNIDYKQDTGWQSCNVKHPF